MPSLLPHIDPDGLIEYSVVYTDHALNHMSRRYGDALRDISAILKRAYHADAAVVVPGGGTFGMEAVARQFALNKRCLIIRNGLFSYRWTQILEQANLTADTVVMQAYQPEAGTQQPFAPAQIDEVCAEIARYRPEVVFAPHVETSSGIVLPDDYLMRLEKAVHDIGGVFVLDCIASGALWVDMQQMGVDVLISAPQKSWSGSPAAGFVMLNEAMLARVEDSNSNSFALDLKKWLQIMQAFEQGGHAYHATPPTDALLLTAQVMRETEAAGLETLRAAQWELGQQVRSLLEAHGFPSVAAPGFLAPGVVVSYTRDPDIQSGKKFAELGVQSAAGVPLQCGEAEDYRSFRLGLFGLAKLGNISRTVDSLRAALDQL